MEVQVEANSYMTRAMQLFIYSLLVPQSKASTSVDLCSSVCIWMYSHIETTDGNALKPRVL